MNNKNNIFNYSLDDKNNVIIEGIKLNFKNSTKELIIPETIDDKPVTRISDCAFQKCENLISVEIPNSVKSIGNSAFSDCIHLTSVEIPNSVTSIGHRAFDNCIHLTNVEIPESVTSIGNETFQWCSSLTKIEMPSSVTNIGENAFHCCTKLKSVTIPNSVTTIGDAAFKGCIDLTSITIPDSVANIGSSAFQYCNRLKSIEILGSVTSIGDRAFEGCESLTSITIPDSVKSIGSCAFIRCNSLTSITIPDSVTSIGEAAFSSCFSLTSIEIPNSVTSIENYAFSNCISLTNIKIPNGVTSIEFSAFNNCRSLESITIPESVTKIGDYAFYYCKSLTSIEIPNSVKEIGAEAFGDCTNLESLEIPNSVERIDERAFSIAHIKELKIPNKLYLAIKDAENLTGLIVDSLVITDNPTESNEKIIEKIKNDSSIVYDLNEVFLANNPEVLVECAKSVSNSFGMYHQVGNILGAVEIMYEKNPKVFTKMCIENPIMLSYCDSKLLRENKDMVEICLIEDKSSILFIKQDDCKALSLQDIYNTEKEKMISNEIGKFYNEFFDIKFDTDLLKEDLKKEINNKVLKNPDKIFKTDNPETTGKTIAKINYIESSDLFKHSPYDEVAKQNKNKVLETIAKDFAGLSINKFKEKYQNYEFVILSEEYKGETGYYDLLYINYKDESVKGGICVPVPLFEKAIAGNLGLDVDHYNIKRDFVSKLGKLIDSSDYDDLQTNDMAKIYNNNGISNSYGERLFRFDNDAYFDIKTDATLALKLRSVTQDEFRFENDENDEDDSEVLAGDRVVYDHMLETKPFKNIISEKVVVLESELSNKTDFEKQKEDASLKEHLNAKIERVIIPSNISIKDAIDKLNLSDVKMVISTLRLEPETAEVYKALQDKPDKPLLAIEKSTRTFDKNSNKAEFSLSGLEVINNFKIETSEFTETGKNVGIFSRHDLTSGQKDFLKPNSVVKFDTTGVNVTDVKVTENVLGKSDVIVAVAPPDLLSKLVNNYPDKQIIRSEGFYDGKEFKFTGFQELDKFDYDATKYDFGTFENLDDLIEKNEKEKSDILDNPDNQEF